jgi:large subunit ribosomal protein L29
MKPSDYRQMSDEQLDLSLKDVVKNLFHLRFQSATDRLETPSEIQKAKRDVARIRTIIRERQLGLRGQKPTAQPLASTGPQGAKA